MANENDNKPNQGNQGGEGKQKAGMAPHIRRLMDGYAEMGIGARNPRLLASAADDFYFGACGITREDRAINYLVSATEAVQAQISQYQAAMRAYEALPEDQRGEAPKQPSASQEAVEIHASIRSSAEMYGRKYGDMFEKGDARTAKSYFTRRDGSYLVEVPEDFQQEIGKASGKVEDLDKDGKARIGLEVLSNYNVNGRLNDRLEKVYAERIFRAMSPPKESPKEETE